MSAARLPLLNGAGDLRVVAAYQHLGTTYHESGKIDQEVRTRIQKARTSVHVIARTILRDKRICPSVRLRLYESSVVSVLLHGAGNWSLLAPGTFSALQSQLLRWQRVILQHTFHHDQHMDDWSFMAAHRLVPLAVRLAKLRLM